MKRLMDFIRHNRIWCAAAAAALLLIVTVTAKSTLAYFTTYVTAKGGYTLALGDSTDIHETMDEWEKSIQIENTGDVSCYVRVQIFCGSAYTLEIAGEGWSLGNDGYWYYDGEVAPGEMSKVLKASISFPDGVKQDFDVAVVQECTPVTYDAAGNPVGYAQADWSVAAQTGEGADR